MLSDEQFLRGIIEPLTQDPEKVVIERSVDDMGVLLTLKVGKYDMGRVLGKSGATIKAVRTILHVFGLGIQARINLKLLEPDGGTRFRKNTELSQVINDLTT